MKNRVSILVIMVFLLLLSFSVPIYAAPVPDGFVGVHWGTSREQVLKMMGERGWREVYKDGKSFYGSFSGFPGIVTFNFTGNSMTGGSAELERATNGSHSKYTFDAAYKILSEKYGPVVIKSENNLDRKSSMPTYYSAVWDIADDVSLDRYWIRLDTMDALYLSDGTRLYTVQVYYNNYSLQERKKHSEI